MTKAKQWKLRQPALRPEFGKEREAAIAAGRAAQVSLGLRLRILRGRYKLTQTELGDRIGISQKYISELECGRKAPSFETLVALAKLGFRTRLSVLFFGIDEPIDDDVQPLEVLEVLLAGRTKGVRSDVLSALRNILRAHDQAPQAQLRHDRPDR